MAAVYCRSIKRGKLEIPDCYPQDNYQKEDELTEENVKRGFTNLGIGNLTPHEYSSARDSVAQIPFSKFAGTFNAILTKKQKNNTFQDVNKKKPLAQNKEFFLPITSKTKSHVSSWLQDLAGRKSLSALASRKVPIFNKKEELLNSVCEHSVPLIRATWFIKMTSAHQMALISDSRNKKRQASEPAQEWTATITKYLKDQLNKLSDFYHQSFQRMSADVELAQKQWHYTVRLTDWLYEENLLDRQEFFHWVVELMEKVKNDDMILKLILPVVLRYLDQIVHSQVLSRTLALCCARKLSSLLSAAEQMRDEQKQNQSNSSDAEYPVSATVPPSTKEHASDSDKGPQSLFCQYKTCAHHQSLVNGLSCILQVITICCPGALIWNSTVLGLAKNGASSEQSSKKTTLGSALDRLALSPSELQLPSVLASSCLKEQIENLLVSKEEEIKARSKAVEKRWFVDSGKTSSNGVMEVTKILEILDFLDKQNFNKVEGTITTEDLYVNIFGSLPKDCTKLSALDEAISIVLIQWVISTHRMGRHRAIIVANLLKKRQSDLHDQLEKLDGEEDDETSSRTSNYASGDPYFQNICLKFLDDHAPVWGDDEVSDIRFCQLVMLYGELIRMDVFSHNAYLCTLISRGDLEPTPGNVLRSASSVSESVLTSHEGPAKLDGRQQEMLHYSSEENRRSTDSTSELNKQLELDQELMLHQEQLQKLLYQDNEPPEDGFVSPFTGSTGFKFDELSGEKPSGVSVTTEPTSVTKEKSQHSLYVKHFPIPKEDNTHELNQRLVVLYGVGKPRVTAMKSIKEFGKELVNFLVKLGELAGRKMEDDKMKVIAEKKQSVYRKFCSFPTFDQYSWVTKCVATVKEMASANMENYGMTVLYPTFGQLSFIIDLYETCNNVPDLLEFLADLLEIRGKLKFNPNVPQETSVYGTLPTKSLLVLGTLRKHQSILLLCPDLARKIFHGFLTTVENISDPAVCSSTERCILAYLFYLYTSCAYLKNNFVDSFDTACNKIKESIICFSKSAISSSSLTWDDKFLTNYFENSRKEKLDVIWKQLMVPDSPEEIYSFVCNAIVNVYNCQERERLYDIGVLCSEVTAHYKALSSEWITVLKALCFSSTNPSMGYTELLDELLSETSFHESVCLFTAILISRSCFSLEDLINHALLPSLPAAVDSGNKIIFEAEPGAQLACQLLFRLLDQSSDNPIIPLSVDKFSFEPTPDRALLYSAQENIQPCQIFAVLKAIMRFSEAESRGNEHETSLNSNDDIFRGLYNDDLIDVVPGQSTDVFSTSLMSTKSVIETTSTSSYANSILQKLCSQEWLKEKCLRDHTKLFSPEALLDPNITNVQAKKLLHLICYPNSFPQSFSVAVEGFPSSSGAEIESCKESANRILKNLNHWSFRNSWLELDLMLNKADKEKVEVLLDCISSACLSLFVESHNSSKNLPKDVEKQDEFIKGPEWLVEPLINKLEKGLHERILKTAGNVLGEKGWWKEQKENGGPSLIHAMPFLHLILSCLKNLADQGEPLLMSLLKQFQDLLEAPIEESHPSDRKSKAFLQDALDLRLRLVGTMFNSIASPKNLQMAADWGTVLFDLISSGILSTECVSENFNHYTNVLDMLSVLINLTTSPETTTNQLSDDSRKFSSGLFKRLKRKLCEKNPRDIEHCKQLLPFPGRSIEVVTVEKSQQNDFSILSESQSSSLENEYTQEGFQVKGRQKISPWELIEGYKNPAPMAFSWFGAVRIERKPLPYQTDLARSAHHNFVKKRPLSYYINPPDDSDDESIDLGSPVNLPTSFEPKGLERLYSSMTNLNAAVKRELPHSAVEQQNSGEKPKAKRQKKTVRATQQQQLTIQQQKVLQEHNFKLNSQIFQQAERPYQQPGQLQTALGVRRLQLPQDKRYPMGKPMMLIPKSQADHLQQRPATAVQPIVYSGRPQTLQNKQISQSPLVTLPQKRRQITQSSMHIDESPMQQLLQSAQTYPFASTQSTQLSVASHTGLSGVSNATSTLTASPSLANTFSSRAFSGPNPQQQLSHQQQRDLQPMQQSFVLQNQGNLQQSSTLLQHPIASSLRLPVAAQQKQFSQSPMNHPKQSDTIRTCLLRQTPVAGQNNPVSSQLILKRQISAPANLSLPTQYSAGTEVSYQGQIPQTQNLAQSSQTQQFPNFQSPFQ